MVFIVFPWWQHDTTTYVHSPVCKCRKLQPLPCVAHKGRFMEYLSSSYGKMILFIFEKRSPFFALRPHTHSKHVATALFAHNDGKLKPSFMPLRSYMSAVLTATQRRGHQSRLAGRRPRLATAGRTGFAVAVYSRLVIASQHL